MIKKLTPLPGPTALVHVPIVLTWLSIWSRVGPARRVTLSYTKDPCSWVTPLAEPTFCSPIFKEIYEKLALPG